MSNILSGLMEATEPGFTLSLRELETQCAYPKVDIRLSAEINLKVRSTMKSLGLDADDTSPRELYHALLGRVEKDEEAIIQSLGGDPNDLSGILLMIKKYVEQTKMSKRCWSLKHSVMRKILATMPPKNVMKKLGYRSIDSLIKREKPSEILAGILFLESASWQKKFSKKYKDLRPQDFELKDIEIVIMDRKRWGDAPEEFAFRSKHNITYIKEAGVVAIIPLANIKKGFVITILPLLLAYINDIRLFSSYIKSQQVKPNFGELVYEALHSDIPIVMTMADNVVHWKAIQRYFGKISKVAHMAIFEPYLLPDDLFWHNVESMLVSINKRMKFWQHLDFVGVVDKDGPMSCNLTDVAICFVNNLPYQKRFNEHLKESLWNELLIRYMGQDNIDNKITNSLENMVLDVSDASVAVSI